MFNRKITSESFDDSLDGFEDFLQDPLATRDLSNKSMTNEASTVDLETGEVLPTPNRTTAVNQKQKVERSTARAFNKVQLPQKEALTSNLSVFITIGASFFFSLMICVIGYFVYSTEFSKLSQEIVQTSAKVSVLDESMNRLQTVTSANDETEEVFNQLENLSNELENLENALQNHLQSANKPATFQAPKKASPSDLLKNVSYLGFFGTPDQPIALITVKDEKKELKTGQLLIDSWQLTAIYPQHITLSHATGMIQNITRKKPLF